MQKSDRESGSVSSCQRERWYYLINSKFCSKSLWFDIFPYHMYEGWNFKSGNYLFTTDTK